MLKLSLIGVCLLVFFLVMAGVASAEVYYLDCTENESIPYELRMVEVNVTGNTVIVNYTSSNPGDAGIHWISLNVEDKPNIRTIHWPELGEDPVDPAPYMDVVQNGWGPFGTFNVNLTLPTDAEDRTAGPVTIVFDDDVEIVEDGHVAAVHLISLNMDGAPSVKVTDCSGDVPIPEFPTVALPIAAVIGLAFLFQRRRDK